MLQYMSFLKNWMRKRTVRHARTSNHRLDEVIESLQKEQALAQRYRDHGLLGDYAGFRECHILPDWLLIYVVDKGKLLLTASRTGTHADLFAK